MSLNHVKLGCEGSFMKYLASIVSLIFLPQILIWNKRTFRLLNLLNLVELVINELTKSSPKKSLESPKKLPIFLFLSDLSLLLVKI